MIKWGSLVCASATEVEISVSGNEKNNISLKAIFLVKFYTSIQVKISP